MKHSQRQFAAHAPTPSKRSSTKTSSSQSTPNKPWSVKLEIRLPHKIGQPLGSSSSDGGGA